MEVADPDVWENELVSGQVTCKATNIYNEVGYTEQEARDYMDNIFTIIHPEDLACKKTAIAIAPSAGQPNTSANSASAPSPAKGSGTPTAARSSAAKTILPPST